MVKAHLKEKQSFYLLGIQIIGPFIQIANTNFFYTFMLRNMYKLWATWDNYL